MYTGTWHVCISRDIACCILSLMHVHSFCFVNKILPICFLIFPQIIKTCVILKSGFIELLWFKKEKTGNTCHYEEKYIKPVLRV